MIPPPAAAARLRSFCPSARASANVGGGVDVAGKRSGLPPIAPTINKHKMYLEYAHNNATNLLRTTIRIASRFVIDSINDTHNRVITVTFSANYPFLRYS